MIRVPASDLIWTTRIQKYATGDTPPAGAIYLSTVTQTQTAEGDPRWFVWHYFLVEVKR